MYRMMMTCASDSLATYGAIEMCFDWLIDDDDDDDDDHLPSNLWEGGKKGIERKGESNQIKKARLRRRQCAKQQ